MSWPAWTPGGFDGAEEHLEWLRDQGFQMVTLVPTFCYAGLQRIDFASAPSWESQTKALRAALERGFEVVLKPRLDPPRDVTAAEARASERPDLPAPCHWRGHFDFDPLCDDYRHGVIRRALDAIEEALRTATGGSLLGTRHRPVRLELGSELMTSAIYEAAGWEKLLGEVRAELKRRRLGGKVLLSHNFCHSFQDPADFALRMDTEQRGALARYIRGLDALALSQYGDLTIAVPIDERERRLPSPSEVAAALLRHEQDFRKLVLQEALDLAPRQIPALHLGEFGIGSGGLRHPEDWQESRDAAAPRNLAVQISHGHRGLVEYLGLSRERTVRSATLWVTGPRYDVFGWMDSSWGTPQAAAALHAFLQDPAPASETTAEEQAPASTAEELPASDSPAPPPLRAAPGAETREEAPPSEGEPPLAPMPRLVRRLRDAVGH